MLWPSLSRGGRNRSAELAGCGVVVSWLLVSWLIVSAIALARIDWSVFGPIPGAIVAVAHGFLPADRLGPLLEIEAFGRMPRDPVKDCGKRLRVLQPHGFDRPVDDEL